jgi:hypothetical protein
MTLLVSGLSVHCFAFPPAPVRALMNWYSQHENSTPEVGFTHSSLSGSRWPDNTAHFSTVTTLNDATHTMITSFGSALKYGLHMMLRVDSGRCRAE